MTEGEWLASSDPQRMLIFLGPRASEHKLRLLGIAACRRIWPLMHDDRCRHAVEASEQFAERLISERQLDLISAAAEEAFEDAATDDTAEAWVAATVANAASYSSSPSLVTEVLAEAIESAANVAVHGVAAERAAQADLLRCILGNPFRPVALDPDWQTPAVLALAEGVSADRAWDRLPILADALDDAGCDRSDILGHLRGPGPHARGCWVVDLILGK